MDPEPFVRLSVGQLGLKLPAGGNASSKAAGRLCDCEIRFGGFPVQTAPVPVIHSSALTVDPFTNAAVFSLDESDLRLRTAAPPGCFRPPRTSSCLEVAVYYLAHFTGGGGGGGGAFSSSRCGGVVAGCRRRKRRRLVGVFRVELASSSEEWRDGKPVLLHHGWAGIGSGKQGDARPELHLRVKLEADPRYVFQFDDEIALNPQVVQLHGSIRQPVFSCKFIRDRRPSQSDALSGWSSSSSSEEKQGMGAVRRERKGWKVVIHDLSGSAVAAAFMATPFVPAPGGGDTVARSNPGAWLIVRADATDSWQPWGRLEAWRESSSSSAAASVGIGKDAAACVLRLHLLPDRDGRDGDGCVLVSEAPLSSDKGGEFFIDMDRQQVPSSGTTAAAEHCAAACGGDGGGGFVMSCRVEGEARSSRPLVQLAMRHVACMEDAAMFVALAAAVDLSVKACRPFRRKPPHKKSGSPSPDLLDLDDT